MTNSEQRALAFLHAAIVEDEDVLRYLYATPVDLGTFVELVKVAAGAMEFTHGRERAAQFVEGWLKLSNENANT